MLDLIVYVARHCPVCRLSRRLAARAARRYPRLRVRVVDLDRPRIRLPGAAPVVPAFVLNGRTIFLGNPTLADLKAILEGELRKHE